MVDEVQQGSTPSVEDSKIKIDDVEYRFGDLPAEVKDMVVILSRWNMEAVDKRLEVAKLEHAAKSLQNEISKTMKKAKADSAMEIKGE